MPTTTLNKGRGIFPLQVLLLALMAGCVPRSTKGGGIFPLQASQLRRVARRMVRSLILPRNARNELLWALSGIRLSRSTVGSHGNHRIQGLPVW